MASTSSTWDSSYMNLKKKINDAVIDKRTKGDNISNSIINDMNKTISILGKDNSKIESENAKRKLLIDNLKKNICLLSQTVSNNNNNNNNNHTIVNPLQITKSYNNDTATSDRVLIERQKDIIRIQDDMLEDISKGVSRVKDQALTMNEEVKLQNKILSKLDQQVDNATEGLREEAKHAEQIRQKSQMCYLYIFALIELIIILILLVVLYG